MTGGSVALDTNQAIAVLNNADDAAAWIAGFRDRGTLREGLAADIVIYDLDRLTLSEPSYDTDFPGGERRLIQKADGYRYTIVNGQVTFEDGVATGLLPGKLLRSYEMVS